MAYSAVLLWCSQTISTRSGRVAEVELPVASALVEEFIRKISGEEDEGGK